MAKKLTSITLNKSIVKSSIDTVGYTITGETGAVFNLQIKDSSTPNKFYNFKTNAFTNTFTSENTLSNVEILSKQYKNYISIPAASSGNTYKFLVFPNRHFDTDGDLLTATLAQESDITVRFTTASDQGDSNFEGIGSFTASTTGFDNPTFSGSSNTSSNTTINTSLSLADGADSVALGYKCSFDKAKGGNFVADSLQPVESDFFIKFTKTTNGTGSSDTEMVLDDVNNLVVGMSLVTIESGTVTTSGSLGVLTFPTITAIDTETLTVTLSSAHSWGDGRGIVFRAYGNDLIRKSVGLTFTQTLKVFPTDNAGNIGALTQSTVTAATNTAVTVSALLGVSAGSRLVGPGIDSTAVTGGFRNDVTAINTSTNVLTMRGNQNVIADNTKVFVTGSSNYFVVRGGITITRFPSIATDFFLDIDRAVILSTTS